MAKICISCGSQMNDEDKVCPMCGTPVSDAEQGYAQETNPAPEQGYYGQAGYTPEQGYYGQAGYTPEQGYYGQAGYTPEQGYYGQTGYPSGQGYYQQQGYMQGQGYYGQTGYAPEQGYVNMQGAAPQKPKKKKNVDNKKIIKIVIAVAVLIVVAVIAVKVVVSFTGYRGTLRKMVNALENEDVDELISLSSSISEEIYTETHGDMDYITGEHYYYEDYCNDMISDTLDKYDDKVGNIKNISYEIKDVDELSDRKIDNLEENLIDEFDIDVSGIKKVLKVDLRLTVKGSERSKTYNVDDYEFYLIKEDDGWTIYYGYLSSYY